MDPEAMMMQGEHPAPPLRDDPPPPPNGSNSVSILLRLSALMLALSSAIVMASSKCSPSSGVVTFTYTRVDGFVALVGCSITAVILEAVAIYLQYCLAAARVPEDKTIATDIDEKEEGIGPPGIVLVVLDLLVPGLLFSAMAVAYGAARQAHKHNEFGSCPPFAAQVGQAEILSLAACAAVTLASLAKAVPLPFNLSSVL